MIEIDIEYPTWYYDRDDNKYVEGYLVVTYTDEKDNNVSSAFVPLRSLKKALEAFDD